MIRRILIPSLIFVFAFGHMLACPVLAQPVSSVSVKAEAIVKPTSRSYGPGKLLRNGAEFLAVAIESNRRKKTIYINRQKLLYVDPQPEARLSPEGK